MKAVCVLHPDGNSGVSGVVTFTQNDPQSHTLISARVTGLKPGKHGFHVHEKGNLTQGCVTAGPHVRLLIVGSLLWFVVVFLVETNYHRT